VSSKPPPPDLFGDAPPPLADPNGEIRLQLTNFDFRETPAAWFLSNTGNAAHGKFVPKSQVRRGVGPAINTYSLPRWLAREKGWL
jgi:hypothetical protein